jgi:hypothetical protein
VAFRGVQGGILKLGFGIWRPLVGGSRSSKRQSCARKWRGGLGWLVDGSSADEARRIEVHVKVWPLEWVRVYWQGAKAMLPSD